MRSIDETLLARTASAQWGLFTAAQAERAGINAKLLSSRVHEGMYRRVDRCVLAIAGVPPTWHQSVMAAVLRAGDRALASHQTAAYLWGLIPRRPTRVEVPRWERSLAQFVVHESKDLRPQDAVAIDGIPATTPERTVVDLGASAPYLVESALDSGLRQELFSLGGVIKFVARVARKGRTGVGIIRPFIDARLTWQGITESTLEDLLRPILEKADLPVPTCQYEILDRRGRFVCRADFAYPDAELRIELDSEAHHMDRKTFQSDRALQNRTELLGWTTLRYTWWDLVARPDHVVEEIAAALRIRLHVAS